MKNVSIRFNSKKEYKEIESKLDNLGYINNKEWSGNKLNRLSKKPFVYINDEKEFSIFNNVPFIGELIDKI